MNTPSAHTNAKNHYRSQQQSQSGQSPQSDRHIEEKGERISLPQPDPENITVLTNKLPNTPILPWNRYDSPWEEAEESEEQNNSDQSDQDEV